MAKYTMELRELFEPIKYNPPLFTRNDIEGWFKDYNMYDYLTENQISVIENARIWDKNKLARKIVNHYYMREIGFETIGLFKHYVKTTMDEIMEKYLPLIYSSSIEYDPLVNVDFTETFERNKDTSSNGSSTSNGNSNSSSSSNTSSLNVSSDTPQGQINKSAILNGAYASETSANEGNSSINDTTTSENSGEINNESEENENYLKRVKGNSGVSATAQRMIAQYRDNIISIDKEIINELNILFMGLF